MATEDRIQEVNDLADSLGCLPWTVPIMILCFVFLLEILLRLLR